MKNVQHLGDKTENASSDNTKNKLTALLNRGGLTLSTKKWSKDYSSCLQGCLSWENKDVTEDYLLCNFAHGWSFETFSMLIIPILQNNTYYKNYPDFIMKRETKYQVRVYF